MKDRKLRDPVLRRWHGKYDVIFPEGDKWFTREVVVEASDDFHAMVMVLQEAWAVDMGSTVTIKVKEVREIPASGEVF